MLYLIAAGLLFWELWGAREALMIPSPERARRMREVRVRLPYVAAAITFALLTLLTSGGNVFRTSTTLTWALSLGCLLAAFWEIEPGGVAFRERLQSWILQPTLKLSIDRWGILLLGALGVSAYFRLANLAEIPQEMWSDHAEKLLDVLDVLDGKYSIFFIRNTGREALQFYLSAVIARVLGTGISFTTLKLGTALAGLVTLPYLYLFAREIGGRTVGLLAMTLAGFAYWPNVISRVGLRFPLYPLFVAPAFFYLVRGLRLKRRNDLLLAGVAVGLGLHGYSPTRALPLAVALGLVLFLVHREGRQIWKPVLVASTLLILVSLIVFLPLIRVALEIPDLFLYRTLTRISTLESPYPGPPIRIFISNLWKALGMFGWDNGTIWIISIPQRPLLDWVTGAFFHLGIVALLIRYLRKREWQDAFTLLSIPILILPSALSLAFPVENPAPNRAAGAMIPVFTLAAIPPALMLKAARRTWAGWRGRLVGVALVGALFAVSAGVNHRLVFDIFAQQHRTSAWNTSEAGAVIRGFSDSIGRFDSAYVVPYSHWMDTRLVGMIAGTPRIDYAIFPDQLDSLLEKPKPLLLLLKPEDADTISRLRNLFPEGNLSRYDSEVEGRDFFIYLVPAGADDIQDRGSG